MKIPAVTKVGDTEVGAVVMYSPTCWTVECHLMEADDFIEVNSTVFHKPFVEKPVSAEDHNVYIYFPTSAGGGSQRLFRKVGPVVVVLVISNK